jgi:carboxyl-terminal processing protease
MNPKPLSLKLVVQYMLFAAFFFMAGLFVNGRIHAMPSAVPEGMEDVDLTSFWKTWDLINKKYPDSDKITNENRVYGAIEGLVGSLNDPYSVFMPPENSERFEEEITGEFSGVGMEVGLREKVLVVISPIKGSPADLAGIKTGDVIIKIDGKVTSGLTVDEAISLIRGEKGTAVTLTMLRAGEKEPLDIKVVRDIINVPTIKGELRTDGVYLISLYTFNALSQNLFEKELQNVVASKSKKLIIDLRGNPGGYLDTAISVSSYFVPEGEIIVTEDYGANKERDVYRSKGFTLLPKGIKVVVLVDGGSASASEIVAGALSEHGKATLIGTKTFGKGSVQELVPVTKDTSLKITVAKWLTPKGNSISEKGLEPDIVVEYDKDSKTDVQLDRAVQFLKTGK